MAAPVTLEALARLPLKTPVVIRGENRTTVLWEKPSEILPRLYLCGEVDNCTKPEHALALGVGLLVVCNAEVGTPRYSVFQATPDAVDPPTLASLSTTEIGEAEFFAATRELPPVELPGSGAGSDHQRGLASPGYRKPGSHRVLILSIDADDEPSFHLLPFFHGVSDAMDTVLRRGCGVLVHCLAGISRSATMLAAYLMRLTNSDRDPVITFLRERRPVVNPNPGFMDQLATWRLAQFSPLTAQASGTPTAVLVDLVVEGLASQRLAHERTKQVSAIVSTFLATGRGLATQLVGSDKRPVIVALAEGLVNRKVLTIAEFHDLLQTVARKHVSNGDVVDCPRFLSRWVSLTFFPDELALFPVRLQTLMLELLVADDGTGNEVSLDDAMGFLSLLVAAGTTSDGRRLAPDPTRREPAGVDHSTATRSRIPFLFAPLLCAPRLDSKEESNAHRGLLLGEPDADGASMSRHSFAELRKQPELVALRLLALEGDRHEDEATLLRVCVAFGNSAHRVERDDDSDAGVPLIARSGGSVGAGEAVGTEIQTTATSDDSGKTASQEGGKRGAQRGGGRAPSDDERLVSGAFAYAMLSLLPESPLFLGKSFTNVEGAQEAVAGKIAAFFDRVHRYLSPAGRVRFDSRTQILVAALDSVFDVSFARFFNV